VTGSAPMTPLAGGFGRFDMRRVDSIRTAWLVMAVAAAVAPPAGADGECFKGYRDTTAAERATMTAALETVRSALPAPAQGWVLQGDDAIAVTQGLCRDYEAGPWSYGFTRYYQRIDDRETRDQILADAAADYSARMAERQAELQALEARVTELTQAAVAAAQAGDYERIETINREIEQYSAQQQRIYDAASVNMEAATAEAGRDQVMTITVTVNPRGESATEGEPIPPPAGAQSAFRSSSAGHLGARVVRHTGARATRRRRRAGGAGYLREADGRSRPCGCESQCDRFRCTGGAAAALGQYFQEQWNQHRKGGSKQGRRSRRLYASGAA